MVRILLARVCLVAVIISPALPVRADRAANWTHARSPHFDLFTTVTTGHKQILGALARLEQVRAFFDRTSFGKSIPSEPVRILVCNGEPGCDAYRINNGAYAYYQRSLRRDYIVMRDLEPEHYDVAVHEYTHSVAEHAALKLPLWLNEGFADLYSTVEVRSDRSILGMPLEGRLIALRETPRIPLQTLFSVDANSPYYRQPDKMQAFYSQSWALTHMLAISEHYAPRFGEFLATVSSGRSAEDALRSVYGRELDAVAADLHEYLQRRTMPTRSLPVGANEAPPEATATLSTPREIDLSFADLIASNPFLHAEAEGRLLALSRRYPDAPEFEESLGYLALEQNRPDQARAHFHAAVDRQSTDSLAMFYCAKLEESVGGPGEQVIGLLQRALAVTPDYELARLELAFRATRAKNYKLAVDTLAQVKAVDPAYAYEVSYTLAFCHAQLKELIDARREGSIARRIARTPEQQHQAEDLLDFLGQPATTAVAQASYTPAATANTVR